MKKIIKSLIKPLALSIGLLTACNEPSKISPESEIKNTNTTEISTDGISIGTYNASFVSNGRTEESVTKFLIFKDQKTFDETIYALSGKSRKELDAWESKLGFTSMRHLYEEVVDVEVKLRQKEEFLSREQQQRIIKYAYVTDLAANSLDFVKADHETGYTLRIYNSFMAKLVDRKGIVQIGKEIHQHGKEFLKIIKDGDISKIDILDAVNDTDKSKNIEVVKFQIAIKPVGVGARAEATEAIPTYRSCETAGPGYPAKYKIWGADRYYVSYSNPGQYYNNVQTYQNFVEVTACVRGFLGFWYNSEVFMTHRSARYYQYEDCNIDPNSPCGVGIASPLSVQFDDSYTWAVRLRTATPGVGSGPIMDVYGPTSCDILNDGLYIPALTCQVQ